MTTITVVRKDGHAAIAADSMTVWGSSNDPAEFVVNHHKIIQVNDCFLAVAGPTTLNLTLKHYFASLKVVPLLDSVDNIFGAWLHLHSQLKDTYFLRQDKDSDDEFESSGMSVLIMNTKGIFGIDSDRCVQECSTIYSYGSGSKYAMGAMHAVYSGPSRAARDIAELGVQTASLFDDSTGLPLVSYTVKLQV